MDMQPTQPNPTVTGLSTIRPCDRWACWMCKNLSFSSVLVLVVRHLLVKIVCESSCRLNHCGSVFNAIDKLSLMNLAREFQKLKYTSPQNVGPVSLQGVLVYLLDVSGRSDYQKSENIQIWDSHGKFVLQMH